MQNANALCASVLTIFIRASIGQLGLCLVILWLSFSMSQHHTFLQVGLGFLPQHLLTSDAEDSPSIGRPVCVQPE